MAKALERAQMFAELQKLRESRNTPNATQAPRDACNNGASYFRGGVYLPLESYADAHTGTIRCRATGAFATLDRRDKGTRTGATQPAGYDEIIAQGQFPANGHMIPNAAGGSGTDLRNLVPEYRHINSPYLRDGVEKTVRDALNKNQTVVLAVTPIYGNANSGIPTEVKYNINIPAQKLNLVCIVANNPAPLHGSTRGSANCPIPTPRTSPRMP